MAATASSHRQVTSATSPVASSQVISSAARKTPFRIKAGRIYDVVATVRGVRAGERLALEANYRRRWHVIGSWKMHRGSYRP
jgi:hypothetical protein